MTDGLHGHAYWCEYNHLHVHFPKWDLIFTEAEVREAQRRAKDHKRRQRAERAIAERQATAEAQSLAWLDE